MIRYIFILLVFLCKVNTSLATIANVGAGLNLGLTGLGVEGRVRISLRFSVGISYFDLQWTFLDKPDNADVDFINSLFGYKYNLDKNSIGYIEIETENKSKFAPTLSVGYDSSAMGTGISFSCEVGAAFIGAHKIKKIKPSGEIISRIWNISSAQDKKKQEKYNSDIKKYWPSFYPMVSVGIKFSL